MEITEYLFSYDTAQMEKDLFFVESQPIPIPMVEIALPSGNYRVVNHELYQIVDGPLPLNFGE